MVLVMAATPPTPGEALKAFRTMSGLTLKATATAAGTSIAYLSKVESGTLIASEEYVARVAKVHIDHVLAQSRRASAA